MTQCSTFAGYSWSARMQHWETNRYTGRLTLILLPYVHMYKAWGRVCSISAGSNKKAFWMIWWVTHSISLEPEAATATPLASCMSESGEPKKRELTRRPNPENIPLGTCSCRTFSPLYNMRTKWRRNRRRGKRMRRRRKRERRKRRRSRSGISLQY